MGCASEPESSLTSATAAIEGISADARRLANAQTSLQLEVLDYRLSICKCPNVPGGLLGDGFCSITRTDNEISVLCETKDAPTETVSREDGWRAFRVCGQLDFGLVGILAKISTALAEAEVPLFAVSTYDTDYILVKDDMLKRAIDELRYSGCEINGTPTS